MNEATKVKVTVRNKNGLHARPSSVLAEAALRYPDTAITVRREETEVDAKLKTTGIDPDQLAARSSSRVAITGKRGKFWML